MLSRPAQAEQPGHCPRCGADLAWRRQHSVQRTWALVIAAAICYVPANILPVLTTNTLVSSEPDTIMSGVIYLYTSGSWPLALIVLVASVMIPLGKLVALAYLLITVQRGSVANNRERTRLYRIVELIGRWSMLDVFVDTFVVALVQLQPLMSVEPGPGVPFFMAVVVLTMLAAQSFDPRLIWDSGSHRQRAMAEDADLDELPRATVVPPKRTRISPVWIIPILAAVVAIGIAVQRILSEGPTITIVFRSAEGIEAGKTFVKYKDVNIGQVTAVQPLGGLRQGGSHGQDRQERGRSDGGRREVLGGASAHHPERDLRARHPAIGQLHRLRGRQLEEQRAHVHRARGAADPHRRVAGPAVRAEGRAIWGRWGSARRSTTAACRSARSSPTTSPPTASRSSSRCSSTRPTTSTSLPATRFWNASGIDVSFGANGLDVRTESLVALLAGGLAFDTPASRPAARARRSEHGLHAVGDRATAMKQPESIARHYVLYFNEPLRGLSVGAPVTFFGLPVGEVTDVGLTFDPKTLDVRPRVDITSFPSV